MAITQVGNIVAGAAKNGADITLTFTTVPAAGDVVYIVGGYFNRNAAGSYGPASGYTQLSIDLSANPGFGSWRKVLTGADTTVVGQGGGNAADTSAYACVVLRGVDNTTPEDVTVQTATGSSTNPDAPAITPTNNDCAIIIGAGSNVSDATPGTVTNYTLGNANQSDTNAYTVAIGLRILSGGGGASEDPPAWNAWTTSTWRTVTIAARPAGQFTWYPMDDSGPNVIPQLIRPPIMQGY